MKSTSKMMVVAAVLLVAAALLVLPASAARVNAADPIVSGDTIFVYEEGLNFSPDAFPGLVKLAYYKDFTSGSPDNTIDYADQMTLLDGQVGSYYGLYYGWDNAGLIGTKPYVNIKRPDVSLDVKLVDQNGKVLIDSIAGKEVTRATNISFKVMSNIGTAFAGSKGTPYKAYIEVTTPGGGHVKVLGDVSLENIALNKSEIFTATIPLKNVQAGEYSAVVKFPSGSPFDGHALESKAVSFKVSTKQVTIESNKESVVRNNPFVVTITGDSKVVYDVYIKDASIGASEYPTMKVGQSGVEQMPGAFGNSLADKERAKINATKFVPNTAAKVTTTAAGTRTVEFSTNTQTNDKTYTIKVVDPRDTSKYDEVKVKVEKGDVTITAEGAGTYYLGEEIKLSGTNTDGDYVYLFMTGPNLGDQNGVALDNISAYAVDGQYVTRDVEADDTWEYRWDTSNLASTGAVLDAGTYTIYAASSDKADNGKFVTKNNLNGVKYKTFSVTLKKPFVTAQTSGATLAKGDELKVTGTAEGKPTSVHVWIFGKNYRKLADSATVEDDGSFEYTLERGDTQNLATGQYFVVVQHPMTDGEFNVAPAPEKGPFYIRDATNQFIDLGRLAASEAATALVDAINSANSDDTYAKLSFNVQEAFIGIDSIGDKAVGQKFTISGVTNLAVGDDLTYDVSGASFKPTEKTQSDAFSGVSGQATVVEGTDYNKWSFEVDATNYKPDQYTVKVESVDADVSTSATFNVLESVPTTPVQPTQSVTTVQPTGTATTTVPATTPTQPGFGALISLIGLGAVAFLVMRRN